MGPVFNEASVVLTLRQDECRHVALAAIEIRTVLQEAVELGAADGRHVTVMPF